MKLRKYINKKKYKNEKIIHFKLKLLYIIMKVYNTCIELLNERGYEILDKDDERILGSRINKFTNAEDQICVFLSITNKFNVESIQEYIYMLKQMEINHCIIVHRENATPVAKKIVEDSKDLIIELFNEDELQCNITKHYLVPKHELVYKKGTKQCIEFKSKYGDKFPTILKSDSVARFYGYERGDIIQITRKNGFVTFRICK
jgi:DNA-directed RNA polymerase I, II, and III subunit RPABC1